MFNCYKGSNHQQDGVHFEQHTLKGADEEQYMLGISFCFQNVNLSAFKLIYNTFLEHFTAKNKIFGHTIIFKLLKKDQ